MKKTVTEKQLAANRANAQKSTGPKSMGGKHNSSLNGKSLADLASTVLIPGEDRIRFYKAIRIAINDSQPADEYELELVTIMAVARWRIVRIWAMESAAITRQQRLQEPTYDHETPAARSVIVFDTLSNPPRSLEDLSRRESRYERIYNHAADRLFQSQQRRRKMPPQSHNVIENREKSPTAEAIQPPGEPSPNPRQTVPEPCPEPDTNPHPEQHLLPFITEGDPSPNRKPPNSEQCDILNQDKKSPGLY